MPKRNKHPAEHENEVCSAHSDNVIENVKYVKMLELQRTVLNKIISTDLNQTSLVTNTNPGNPDCNNSQTNK
jgi:hypothetical protein